MLVSMLIVIPGYSYLGPDKRSGTGSKCFSTTRDQIEVVFCNNDGMALGAAQALEMLAELSRRLSLGVDALDECQEMVKEGTMTGTVLPTILANHTPQLCSIKLLNGEEGKLHVDYVKVDKNYFN